MAHEGRTLLTPDIIGDDRRLSLESVERVAFRDQLLALMEQKTHWAESAFAGLVPKEKMEHHFRDEYHVFVEPFPRYLAGAFAQCPIPEVRADLAENIDEEQNGRTAQRILEEHTGEKREKMSHAELFLLIPQGMGFDTNDFHDPKLGPRAQAYRDFLFDSTQNHGWEVAVAISTLFLEGNKHERSVFAGDFPDASVHTPVTSMEDHPLHKGYGLHAKHLLLPVVHHVLDSADGEHRLAAWRMLLEHIPTSARPQVISAMQLTLQFWHAWRDEVATQCGIERGPDGAPRLKAE